MMKLFFLVGGVARPARTPTRTVSSCVLRSALAAAAIGAALGVSAAFTACVQNSQAQKDKPAELREWKGEALDSISKFQENSIAGPQRISLAKYHLAVTGLVAKPMAYTYEQVLAHPSTARVVTLRCVEGWDVKALWEGVVIKDLLAEAEVKPEATTVIFKCYDGYSTSAPVDYIMKDVLLVYKVNGLTLPPARGYPLALLAEDKWGYKSARWVTTIELSNNPKFRGYWESRGYNNNGDLSGPMFENERRR